MHPEEIKAAIRMNGTTPSVIAAELEVSRTTVSTVIHGRCESARVKERIAKVINKPVDAIWPPSEKLPQVSRKDTAA
jgi:lambda repressor-like predicted transcriptional regulator